MIITLGASCLLEVTFIEIPPHSRTLKVLCIDSDDPSLVEPRYIQIPYTQFYFVENREMEILITNTTLPAKQELPKYSLFESNTFNGYDICWGSLRSKLSRPYDYNRIISDFWLSIFTAVANKISPTEAPITIHWE